MVCPYDKIIEMMKKIDLQDDGIVMNQKIKYIHKDFCSIVLDENMLSESMEYINEHVLLDSDAAMKFAILISSTSFDSLALHEFKVRNKMLGILQDNFACAAQLREKNKNILYNSITLLGEYYHRVRLVDGSPIVVLGESLLDLLIKEISINCFLNISFQLANLILKQISLNGLILRKHHDKLLYTLLFYIRKNLIDTKDLTSNIKALLLMTLDLCNNNFNNLGTELEDMYTKYLIEENGISVEPDSAENDVNQDHIEDQETFNSSGSSDIMKTKWSDEVSNNHTENSINEIATSRTENDISHGESETPRGGSEEPYKQIEHKHNYKNSHEDDISSVRSEGGTIRRYNINDRIQNNQNNMQNWRKNQLNAYNKNRNKYKNSNQNHNLNPNQGYENEGNDNRNNRFRNNYNNNRPPRFNNNDNWRADQINNFREPSNNINETNGHSPSQSRNFQRPQHERNHFQNFNGRTGNQNLNKQPNNLQNDNPQNGHFRNYNRQNSRNFHNRNKNYANQNSLCNDSNNTWDKYRNSRYGKLYDNSKHLDDEKTVNSHTDDAYFKK